MLNRLRIDFSQVKYENVKINMKNILENFCYHSFLQFVMIKMIPLIQIYYFSKYEYEDKYKDLAIINFYMIQYGLAYFSLKILFCFIEFLNEICLEKYFEYFHKKDYYEIGNIFRKIVLISEILNIFTYYPFILCMNYTIKYLIFGKNSEFLPIIDKVYNYHSINFFTLVLYSFNKPLSNMFFCFRKLGVTNLNIFLKFIVNITFCKYFTKKNIYFLYGIAYADLISELSSFLFLLISQYITNPYPQAWIRLDAHIVYLKDLISSLNPHKLYTYLLLNVWRKILTIIYAIIKINPNTFFSSDSLSKITLHDKIAIKNIEILIFLYLLKDLFFSSTKYTMRKTVQDISNYFSIVLGSQSTQPLNNTNKPNKNYNWIRNIKSKIIGCFVINFILFLIFVLCYLLDVFFLMYNEHIPFPLLIAIFIDGLLVSLTIELYTMNMLLENKQCMTYVYLGSVASLICFLIFVYLEMNLFFIILSFSAGNYLILYLFYSYIKGIDMRVINLDKLITYNQSK